MNTTEKPWLPSVGHRVWVPCEQKSGLCIESNSEFGIVGVQFDDGSRRWGCIEQVEPAELHAG